MTTADYIERRRAPDNPGGRSEVLQEAADSLRERGATFMRAHYRAGSKEIIVEGWRERPEDQGDLPL